MILNCDKTCSALMYLKSEIFNADSISKMSMLTLNFAFNSFSVIRYTSINCFIAMQAMHKPITRKSSPICASHIFLQILMPTYINAIPIAMNIIDNAVNIYYTSISEFCLNPKRICCKSETYSNLIP